jgi:hypothetical protein
MAESYINLTEGAGKKAHTFGRTIGANNVEDEVVVPGEPYLASYVVQSTNLSIATGVSRLLSLNAGSSLIVRVHRIMVQTHTLAGTNTREIFLVSRLTSAASGGTAITPRLLDPSDPAAGATAMAAPTGGTVGAELWRFPFALFSASAAGQQEPWYEWVASPNRKPIIIPAGTANGIVVQNLNSVATATVSISVWFDESNF